MKVKEFILEAAKSKTIKPRNFVAKNAIKTTSGSGQHKDKKRAEKQGDVKHKKDKVPMEGIKNSGISKSKEDKFHSELDKLVHKTFGHSPDEKKEKKKIKEGDKQHISPSGVKTNMDRKDDDYAINYGKKGLVAKFRKEQGLDIKTGSKKVSESVNDLNSLRKRLVTYEIALKKAREITKEIKYADVHSTIIVGIKTLAEKTGIEEREFNYQIDQVYEAASKLESEIYGLEEPFQEAVRLTQDAIDELENEEWERNNPRDAEEQ
jgi:hypothetical protein